MAARILDGAVPPNILARAQRLSADGKRRAPTPIAQSLSHVPTDTFQRPFAHVMHLAPASPLRPAPAAPAAASSTTVPTAAIAAATAIAPAPAMPAGFDPRYLIAMTFEGGRAKGFAYPAALRRAVEELRGYGKSLDDVQYTAGTSIGAPMAALLAAGCDAEQIADHFLTLDPKYLLDDSPGFLRGLRRLIRRFGYYKGASFDRWLGDILEKKLGDRDITFEALHARVQSFEPGLKDLSIVVTNLNRRCPIVCSWKTTPKIPIRQAVRASMAFPPLVEPLKMKPDPTAPGTFIMAEWNDPEGEFVVDGGIPMNDPQLLFDRWDRLHPDDPRRQQPRREGVHYYNPGTMAFRLDEPSYVAAMQSGTYPPAQPISGPGDYASRILKTLHLAEQYHLMSVPAYRDRTVAIPIELEGLQLKVTPELRAHMNEVANQGAEMFFRDVRRRMVDASADSEGVTGPDVAPTSSEAFDLLL